MAANSEGVLVSGADNGTLFFWDWRTGYNFQRFQAPVQPGSLDSEAGVFAMTFDQSGSRCLFSLRNFRAFDSSFSLFIYFLILNPTFARLITCEADKTIKVYREDDKATEETHPITWKPDILKRRF